MTTKPLFLLFCTTVLNLGAAPAIIEPAESRPVEIGGLEFSVVTQDEWVMPELPENSGGERSTALQLRITNSGSTPILFPTIDTFRPRLEGPDGENVEFMTRTEKWSGADPPAVLLRPGRSYSIPLRVRMLLGHATPGKPGKPNIQLTSARISYTTKPILPPGEYALSMELFPTKSAIRADGKIPRPLWSAEGKTESVAFRIVAAHAN